MFQCSIELIYSLDSTDDNFCSYVVARNEFDPGLKIGDELVISDWDVWYKSYTFKAIVVGRKLEVRPPDNKLVEKHSLPSEAAIEGAILLRIFVEAEDQDKVLELHETIQQNI